MREVAETLPVATTPTHRSGAFASFDTRRSHAPGDTIDGRYQLIRKLNQGGMGVVWIALHLGLDVQVALKLVNPDAGYPEAAERLIREARTASRLDHPAIVDVIDAGRTAEGAPFLAMELLEGESIGDALNREERIDVETSIRALLPIADALHTMHTKGMVHRDIKPENIFLARSDTGRWQPKLIDFGLVGVNDSSNGRLSRQDIVLGTLAYISPERLRGEEARPTDDVWALCVVLYEMVTGARPFSDDTILLLLVEAADARPRSLAEHGVEAPELWAILQRGFRARGERYASVQELGAALAGELLRRGVAHDISGGALRARWTTPGEENRPAANWIGPRAGLKRGA